MLMFRSRRNALVKRLWKARLGGSDEEGREVRKWLLRRLAEDQLDTLVTAVESRGGGSADCVLVEQIEECPSPELLCCQVWRWPDLQSTKQLKKLPMCKSSNLAGSTCCNPFHWSRLCLPAECPPPPYSRFSSERLKPEDRAPSESSQLELRGSLSTNGEETDSSDASEMDLQIEELDNFGKSMEQLGEQNLEASERCEQNVEADQHLNNAPAGACECNRSAASGDGNMANIVHDSMFAHTTSLCKPELVYTKFDEINDFTSLQHSEEKLGSSKQWCRLAYWELSTRVGRQYPVESPSINVFWSTPHGDGLCLATLAMHSFSPPNIVRRTREKIGEGITLSREEDGIWAYNRSDCPMFVNSPALDDEDGRLMLVYRVPPGHCLNIFSEAARARLPVGSMSRPHVGPIDPNSVRISFAKGWGPKYSRQEVTSCPTWLEVLLAPCR